ncbi:MAG: DUF190 domain-containing protein [Desulfuromonadia bacterium]
MVRLSGEKWLMRIFIGESDRFGHRPLHEAIVELFRRRGFAGATVLRGVSGFGAHRVFHTQKLLDLSADLPIVIEVVDDRERFDAILPELDGMIRGGLITVEKVNVLRYSHPHETDTPGRGEPEGT